MRPGVHSFFARLASRRSLAPWLGCGVLATGAAWRLPVPGQAGRCKPNQRYYRKRCRNVATDRRHCGRCNQRCEAGERCRRGACRTAGAGTSPRRPFPQQLAYGIIRPSITRDALDDDVRAFYDLWKRDYLVRVDARHYRVAFARANPGHQNTVSEGQGYGMMIVAIMAGHEPRAQVIFDGLWRFARNHRSDIDPRLMDWNVRRPTGNTSAFDGDADMAYGLLLADAQWGSDGEVDYLAAFDQLIAGIRSSTIGPDSKLPELGDWVAADGETYNQFTPRSSDFMPGHFRAFGRAGDGQFWDQVITATSQVITEIQAGHSPDTGLLPDFIVPDPVQGWRPAPADFLGGPHDDAYNYNAGRVPWRLGTDALLNQNPTSAAQARRISAWAKQETNGDPRDLKSGYRLDGTPLPNSNYFSTFFAAPIGVAAMNAADQQAWLDAIYAAVRDRREDYYEDSVNLLCLLVMSGNFWQP